MLLFSLSQMCWPSRFLPSSSVASLVEGRMNELLIHGADTESCSRVFQGRKKKKKQTDSVFPTYRMRLLTRTRFWSTFTRMCTYTHAKTCFHIVAICLSGTLLFAFSKCSCGTPLHFSFFFFTTIIVITSVSQTCCEREKKKKSLRLSISLHSARVFFSYSLLLFFFFSFTFTL